MILNYNQEYKNEAFIRYGSTVCKGGVVVRALVPRQCRPGSNPGFHALCQLSKSWFSPLLAEERRERKEDGKPCVTSVTTTLIEKTFLQT